MSAPTRTAGAIQPDQPRMVPCVVSTVAPSAANRYNVPLAAAFNEPCARAGGQTDPERTLNQPRSAPTIVHMPIIRRTASHPGAEG